ncbi:hypothetical protein MG293_006431 [Ovis ammon polii]|uniref:Uncharacterized protein n=1 Tax=Ovis ammon polii TaxID=230172 RepID=A0AAD4UFF2_OVIAM|nr:hypothetical protein MG293_006431 [Ovis ammon polii]
MPSNCGEARLRSRAETLDTVDFLRVTKRNARKRNTLVKKTVNVFLQLLTTLWRREEPDQTSQANGLDQFEGLSSSSCLGLAMSQTPQVDRSSFLCSLQGRVWEEHRLIVFCVEDVSRTAERGSLVICVVCGDGRIKDVAFCNVTLRTMRRVLQNALLLSDSSLHLFLQSHLNSEDIEACVSGQTKYSVEEAIHKFALMNRRFPEEEEGKKENDIDYDSERYVPVTNSKTISNIQHKDLNRYLHIREIVLESFITYHCIHQDTVLYGLNHGLLSAVLLDGRLYFNPEGHTFEKSMEQDIFGATFIIH